MYPEHPLKSHGGYFLISFIYLLGCNKCPQQYIGETERMLKERFSEHKGYVSTQNISKNRSPLQLESVSDMRITVLEKVFPHELQFRKKERNFISKSSTQDTRDWIESMGAEEILQIANHFFKKYFQFGTVLGLFMTMWIWFDTVWCGSHKKTEIYHFRILGLSLWVGIFY